ncbi:MAG TPA: hypothetical protein VMV69_22855 [Pirellulales bacterium]|nr:hypothetical protein [Pirellulales bacterium]
MNDLFGKSYNREEWTVQLTYPQTMIAQHATTFCGWSSKLRGTLAESTAGKDTKDGDCEVVIQRFEFTNYDDAAEFCRYTRGQFDKWSGAGHARRYTMKIRGRVKFDDKTEGRVGSSHPTSKAGATDAPPAG